MTGWHFIIFENQLRKTIIKDNLKVIRLHITTVSLHMISMILLAGFSGSFGPRVKTRWALQSPVVMDRVCTGEWDLARWCKWNISLYNPAYIYIYIYTYHIWVNVSWELWGPSSFTIHFNISTYLPVVDMLGMLIRPLSDEWGLIHLVWRYIITKRAGDSKRGTSNMYRQLQTYLDYICIIYVCCYVEFCIHMYICFFTEICRNIYIYMYIYKLHIYVLICVYIYMQIFM